MAKKKHLLLTEDIDPEQREELFEDLAGCNDPYTDVIGAGAELLTEENSGELTPEMSQRVSDAMTETRNRRMEAGQPILTEDFDYAFDALLRSRPQEFTDAWEATGRQNNSAMENLTEAGPTGLRASHWKHMVDQCLTTIFTDLQCADSPWTTADMFQNLPSTRCDQGHVQFCERVPKSRPDMCCEVSDQPATFVNEVMERVCWKIPNPCVRSIAYGLHEDLSCISGAREQVQNDMETMIMDWQGQTAERERISTLFGMPACSSCSTSAVSTQWNYDNQTTEGYQNAGDSLWTNSYYGKEFNPDPSISGTCEVTDLFIDRLKRIWKNTVNWHTQNPVECGLGQYQLFLPDEMLGRHFAAKFGAYTSESCHSGGCPGDTKETVSIAGDPEFSGTFKTSRWARECLVQWFLDHDITVKDLAGATVVISKAGNTATAEYRADNTYLISRNWTATFANYQIDNFQRELTGRNHWHYFDRGYDYAKRLFWGYQFAPQRPWLTSRVFAFDAALAL